jgi:large subunit ribosomal protein L25
MARPKLKVEERKVFGRKVKHLRSEDVLPANIYGKKVKSQAVKLPLGDFLPVYQEVGETGLVDLLVGKSKSARPVLVHNVQFDPVTGQAIHVDFHQVDLKQKITAQIPVELVGESPIVAQKKGILVRLLDEIEVEALATDLPEKIEVDISSLEKVDDMIKLGGLKLSKKLTLVTDPKRLVAKVEPPTKLEEEKPKVEEVVEGETAEGETAEGEVKEAASGEETSVEGETKPEKKQPETEKQEK